MTIQEVDPEAGVPMVVSQPAAPVITKGVPVPTPVPVVSATAAPGSGGAQPVPVVGATAQGGVNLDLVNLDRRSSPTRCKCPNCRQEVVSRVDYEPGGLTWLISGILCLFGCWLGCCLIPFCVDDCKVSPTSEGSGVGSGKLGR